MLLDAPTYIVPFRCTPKDLLQPVVNGVGEGNSRLQELITGNTVQSSRKAIEKEVLCDHLRLVVSVVIFPSLDASVFKDLLNGFGVTVVGAIGMECRHVFGQLLCVTIVNPQYAERLVVHTHLEKPKARTFLVLLFHVVQDCDGELDALVVPTPGHVPVYSTLYQTQLLLYPNPVSEWP